MANHKLEGVSRAYCSCCLKIKGKGFEEFLKQGHKQQGIDIVTVAKGAKYIAIQCKHENLSVSKLNNLYSEFINGTFFQDCGEFILATTSDLQTPSLQKCLTLIGKELQKNQIAFEPWDKTYLEDHLKYQYTLVAQYFSLEDAKRHCFLPGKREPTHINLGAEYIPRRIFSITEHGNSLRRWYLNSGDTLTLGSIFQQRRLAAQHICLIGDPYQGKSTLLKQTAFELTQLELPYRPIIIQFKSSTKPVSQILTERFGTWESIPAVDLIVIVDGLDEVPTDKFKEAVDYIDDFVSAFPFINLIFSCRKLFFYHYSMELRLHKFKIYELYDLTFNEVHGFLKQTLKKSYQTFIAKINNLDLESLLYDPFYLSELIQSHSNPPYSIPDSKTAVIDSFISKSIQKADLRSLSNGRDFKHSTLEYQLVIKKLAFAMQLLGTNSLESNQVQILFSENERELLQHSALVTVADAQWSFTSALFQEFLSARVLLNLDIANVLALTTLGQTIVKVKAKWLQTFTTLLALTEKGSKKQKSYLNVLEADNIELIFQTDRSKFDEELRFVLLQKALKKFTVNHGWPTIVHENKIGAFIQGDNKAIEQLIKLTTEKKQPTNIKIISCDILIHARPDSKAIAMVSTIMANQIRKVTNVTLASKYVEMLTFCRNYDVTLIDRIIVSPVFNQVHSYRSKVYRYIVESGLVDRYYNYGLQGISALVEHNRNVHAVRSEANLFDLLLRTESATNTKALFHLMQQTDWLDYFKQKNDTFLSFLNRLATVYSRIFKTNPEIIFSLISFIRTLKRTDLLDEYEVLNSFFTLTDSSVIAVLSFSKEILDGRHWEYSSFLTEDTIEYLMFEFEEGNHKLSALRHPLTWLHKSKKNQVFEKLNKIYLQLSELEPETESDRWHREWEKLELKKHENDIKYLQSQDALADGVATFFLAKVKKALRKEELYIEVKDPESVKNVSSNILYTYLAHWRLGNKKSINVKDCIEPLKNANYYDYFRISEALNMCSETADRDEPIRQILNEYYQKEVRNAIFENCYRQKGSKTIYSRKEVLLGEIFKKFKFKTSAEILMKMVWLDTHGIRDLDLKTENNDFAELVLQLLPSTHVIGFRHEIMANLENGILLDEVFGTHIAICDHLNIVEALPVILKRIESKQADEWEITRLTRVFTKLGGELRLLVPTFTLINDFTKYHFFVLADVLINEFRQVVETQLMKCLNTSDLSKEIRAKAAEMLAHLGRPEGFKFLVAMIKNDGILPIDLSGNFNIKAIDTSSALLDIQTVGHVILHKHTFSSRRRNMAGSIILEWLFELAGKSEKDLQLVVAFLETTRKRLKTNPNSDDFFRYIERCEEKFREVSRPEENIDVVKRWLAKIA